jgi:zinc transport system permease protein
MGAISMINVPDYLLLATLGGMGVVLMASPLGALLLWRRMAFIGDTLAHASLLGIGLAFCWHLPLVIGVLMTSVIIGIGLAQLRPSHYFSQDAILAVLTYSLFAAGLILLASMQAAPMSLLTYLYGDILILSWSEIAWIFAVAFVVLIALWRTWKKLLIVMMSPELAQIEGIPVRIYENALMLCLAMAIAFAIKIVGVLLVAALLIIPNVTSRLLSRHPWQMIGGGIVIGCLSVILGLMNSYYFDWPTGPTIVLASFVIFLLVLIRQSFFKKMAKK